MSLAHLLERKGCNLPANFVNEIKKFMVKRHAEYSTITLTFRNKVVGTTTQPINKLLVNIINTIDNGLTVHPSRAVSQKADLVHSIMAVTQSTSAHNIYR